MSLSGDGNVVAIGASYNDGNGVDSGHVRVYQDMSWYSCLQEYKARDPQPPQQPPPDAYVPLSLPGSSTDHRLAVKLVAFFVTVGIITAAVGGYLWWRKRKEQARRHAEQIQKVVEEIEVAFLKVAVEAAAAAAAQRPQERAHASMAKPAEQVQAHVGLDTKPTGLVFTCTICFGEHPMQVGPRRLHSPFPIMEC